MKEIPPSRNQEVNPVFTPRSPFGLVIKHLILLLAIVASTEALAASYQRTDGTIVDPILIHGTSVPHSYEGPDLVEGVDAPGAQLSSAGLEFADLDFADLDFANFAGASLRYASLSDAHLSQTNLTDANLTGADLERAQLTLANLANASLFRANIQGADLTGADLTNTDLTGAVYNASTQFPSGFDPSAAGMWLQEIIVINNGLAPPNPENILDHPYPDPTFFARILVNNEGCDASRERHCANPGDPTEVTGFANTVEIFDTSTFHGSALTELQAYDSSNVVIRDGDQARLAASDSANMTIESCYRCDASAADESFVEAVGGFEGFSASGRSHSVFRGAGDVGDCVYVRDDAFLEYFGAMWCMRMTGGHAVMYPRPSVGRRHAIDSMSIGEGALFEQRGGLSGEFTNSVEGTLLVTDGAILWGGIVVTGHASISGGSVSAHPEPVSTPYGLQPGPWNFIAEEGGVIHLSGGTLNEHVSLAARDQSSIRIFGEDFSVDGAPVPYGFLKQRTGVLSGTLASGDTIENAFAQRGGDCDGEACTGRIMVFPSRYLNLVKER